MTGFVFNIAIELAERYLGFPRELCLKEGYMRDVFIKSLNEEGIYSSKDVLRFNSGLRRLSFLYSSEYDDYMLKGVFHSCPARPGFETIDPLSLVSISEFRPKESKDLLSAFRNIVKRSLVQAVYLESDCRLPKAIRQDICQMGFPQRGQR
jgi:hypothetical protein